MGEAKKHNPSWLEDGDMTVGMDGVTAMLDELYLSEPDEDSSNRALARVSEALLARGVGTLYYDVIPETPVGPIYIAMSERGIADLGFDDSEEEFLKRMGKRYRFSIQRSRKRIEEVAGQLSDYFTGERDTFNLTLDLRKLTPFQNAVLGAIQEIPAGKTISYSELAKRIGKPKAARAVGQALGRNPIPIIIPCHRALAADGSLGGYSGRGGVRTKQALLTLEGAWG